MTREPEAAWRAVLRGVLHGGIRAALRVYFRLRVRFDAPLPASPVVFAPNHASSLDAHFMAAALPAGVSRRTRVAARREVVVGHGRIWRMLTRAAGAVPIPDDPEAVAVAIDVLRAGQNLVWFPEGRRTRTGALQPLRPGIGRLMERTDVAVVPVWIDGAFAALPPGRRFPTPRRPIEVRFGRSVRASDLVAVGFVDRAAVLTAVVDGRLRALRETA